MVALLRPPLVVSQFEARTLSWWRSRSAKIDMSPSYQRRGRLWSAADKSYLIDSIINGFDIPKLYIADFTYSDSKLNEKKLPYAIIDGKQRFEAIFDFFEGGVVLHDEFVYLEDKSLDLKGLGYKDLKSLHPDIAEIFDNFNLSVMSVVTNDEDLINQLFVRLNRSKPLTGAEIRNAMSGPAPEVIRTLSRHPFFVDQIAFPVSRGQDQNAAAKILAFEFADRPVETKKTTLDGFVGLSAADPAKLELAARRAADTLGDLTSVFLPKDKLLGSAGAVPVYYWFVRDMPPAQHQFVRDFLIKFEADRRANRKKAELNAGAPDIDRKLVEYDQYNRNTNDQVSHVQRVETLKERFAAYIGLRRQKLLLQAALFEL
jgi:hypothetical protein